MEITTDSSDVESPTQRQARIRREKREKKILSGASSRLDKITSLSGRPVEQGELNAESVARILTTVSSPLPGPPPIPNLDSPHVFQSQSLSQPLSRPNVTNEPTQAEIETSMRQLLRSNEQASIDPRPQPFRSPNASASRATSSSPQHDDPMMRLLQQMIGAQGSSASSGEHEGQQTGLPPGIASMLGSMPSSTEDTGPHSPTNAYVWKIVHAVFALALALNVLFWHGFSGSLTSRLRVIPASLGSEGALFWVFVTAELGLQSTRFLLEGGRNEKGLINTISGLLPPPWSQRLLLAGRYSGIWTTVVADAMVLIWVLGAAAWWRGELV